MGNIVMARTRKNKKAQIQSFITLIVSVTVIAITLLIAKLVYDKIGEGLNENNDFATNESVKAYQDFAVSFTIFDISMIFIVLGLTIGMVITSFFIPTHPIFMVINIIGMIFLCFMAAILANLYGEIIDVEDIQDSLNMTDAETGEVTQAWGRTSFIMSRLPWICLFIVAIITIIMYAKGSRI